MGPYLIQLWRVCYVWKIVLSGWLFQILIVQFRLYLQPPWIVIIKTYTFITGSKRVANSLSCERQGNVAVMNGSLGSEWFSAQVPPCSQSSSVILQNRSSKVLALYWRSDCSSALGYVRVINTNAVKNLQSNGPENHCAFITKGGKPWREKSSAHFRHGVKRICKLYPRNNWPANSPGVSPLETIWRIVDGTTYKEPTPKTLDELRPRLRFAWKIWL